MVRQSINTWFQIAIPTATDEYIVNQSRSGFCNSWRKVYSTISSKDFIQLCSIIIIF
jgi:hypothetical protein